MALVAAGRHVLAVPAKTGSRSARADEAGANEGQDHPLTIREVHVGVQSLLARVGYVRQRDSPRT